MYLSAFENPIGAIGDIFRSKILFLEINCHKVRPNSASNSRVSLYVCIKFIDLKAQRINPKRKKCSKAIVGEN